MARRVEVGLTNGAVLDVDAGEWSQPTTDGLIVQVAPALYVALAQFTSALYYDADNAAEDTGEQV